MTAVSSVTDIRTVLKLALPIGSRLLVGHPTTPITWVRHLRHYPLTSDSILGRELVLVSSQIEALPLDGLIKDLVQRHAGALAVQGTITPRAQQVARTHNFPLISLPERTALPQSERAVQRLLSNRQAQLVRRVSELQQTLRRHAASYRGLTTMLNALARMLDRPVVTHDRRGNLLSRGLPASHGHEWDSHLELVSSAEFVRRFDLENRTCFEDHWQVIESPAGLTAPLIHDGRLLGYASILSGGDALDDFDLMVLEQSAPLLVREMVRQQTAEPNSVEPLLPARDWITDWLSGTTADDALLALRAEKDNFRAGTWYAVVLFHWVPSNERAGSAFSPERMVKLIQGEMRQRRIQTPVGQYADRTVLLFPLDEPQQTQRLKQMVTLLHGMLAQAAPDGEVTAGVGRPVQGLTALRESFQEAERALTLSEQLWDESQVASFGDLSLYELLLNVNDQTMLREFSGHWLSPLADYDRQHHTDLLPTLSAYFANNGNMARTAHVLNIHRNTLVYRLSRITEIMQLDMDDSNVRLNLHLALKIERMLNHGTEDQSA